MKYLVKLNVMLILFAALFLFGCDEDDAKPVVQLEASQVTDLNSVSTKNYTLFSFSDNAIVQNSDSSATKWDIGFRGTTIILSGGSSGPGQAQGQIVAGVFNELTEAPEAGFLSDSENEKAILGSNGWYSYTGTTSVPNHAILPIAGKILVLKTANGRYAKVEIISYYQGNPDTTTPAFADLATRPASRYFTFRFIYQPDGTRNFETTE